MEKGNGGDLADIVLRASGGGGVNDEENVNWDQISSEPLGFDSTAIEEDVPLDGFGDPFSNMQDPLMRGMNDGTWSLMDRPTSSSNTEVGKGDHINISSTTSTNISGNIIAGTGKSIFDEGNDQMKRASTNIFSKMLQISPNSNMSTTSLGISPIDMSSSSSSLIVNSDHRIGLIKANSSAVCNIENRAVQISSPRNPGIKRRKSQAKKVVCIPAPAAVNSRPTGEVVPSDLWAWRKYGQKPIKGSPYPRGYYRCSSSKGCSARKQVERSRTDPNMLVITYTSEHNHPWPTQRNALAGSTRNPATKSNANSKNASSSSQVSKLTNMKEELDNSNADRITLTDSTTMTSQSLMMTSSIKEEPGDIPMAVDMRDSLFDHQHDYIPEAPFLNPSSDDFFANLEELQTDPLNLLFDPQGFSSERSEDQERQNKAPLDPFSLFDWTSNN